MPEHAAPHSEAAPPRVADYSRLLRNHWAVVLVATLLGLALALGYVLVRPVSYTSSTSVLVTPTGGMAENRAVNSRTSGVINLDTEAQLVRSDAVLDDARAALGTEEPTRQFARRVSVTVPPNSELLVVTFVAQDAELAERGSSAVAEAYLDARGATAQRALDAELEAVEDQIGELRTELAAAAVDVAEAAPESPDRLVAAAERDRIQAEIAATQMLVAELQRVRVTPGRVVTAAAPAEPDGGTLALIALVSGPFAGFVLGLGAALLREHTRRSVRDADDVPQRTRLPVLLRLPEPASDTPPADWSPRQLGAFVRLRNEIDHLTDLPPRVILVAGTSAGIAADAVATGLAASLRADGVTVSQDRGGSSGAWWRSAASDDKGIVVVHAPPTSESPQAQTLAARSDVVLLVVEEGTSTLADLEDAARQMDEVTASAVGVVMVPRVPRRGRGRSDDRDGLPGSGGRRIAAAGQGAHEDPVGARAQGRDRSTSAAVRQA